MDNLALLSIRELCTAAALGQHIKWKSHEMHMYMTLKSLSQQPIESLCKHQNPVLEKN